MPEGYVWIALWTGVGLLIVWMLYRLLRCGVPERLALTPSVLVFDTGLSPTTVSINWRLKISVVDGRVAKRERIEFPLPEIATLRLHEFPYGNRLTLSKKAILYVIGASLSPLERRWLYQRVCLEYKLLQQAPSGAVPPPLN